MGEFLSDWTPSHELSHMLHPRISGNIMWIYEGLPSDRAWSADEFFSKLDELSGELSDDGIFISLYQHYGHAYQFPNYQEALDSLGLKVVNNNILTNDAAANAGIRKAIMGDDA